jgi:predicted MFS family arabinose efflux permease
VKEKVGGIRDGLLISGMLWQYGYNYLRRSSMLSATARIYKNAYSGLSRETWLLSLVMLINRSGAMVLSFMPVYIVDKAGLGWEVWKAGVVMACFGAGSLLGAFLGGRITDKWGFYALQIGALITGGAMFIVVGYLREFIPLCAGTFMLSLCNESFRPANSTAIAHYSAPENRTRSYSLNRLAINLGFAMGSAVAGILADIDYHLLFWVDGLTNIAAAVMMFLLLPVVRKKKDIVVQQLKAVSSPYKDLRYLFFIFMIILYAICFLQLFSMMALFFNQRWDLSKSSIGMLMAVNGLLIAFIEMILVYHIEKKRTVLYFIRTGALLTGVGYVMVNFAPASFMSALITVILVTLGEIFVLPFANNYWLSRSTEKNRGSYAAVYTMAWSTAHIMAPTFGSQVIQHAGFTVLWWLVGLICVMIAVGAGWLGRR